MVFTFSYCCHRQKSFYFSFLLPNVIFNIPFSFSHFYMWHIFIFFLETNPFLNFKLSYSFKQNEEIYVAQNTDFKIIGGSVETYCKKHMEP